MSFSTPTISINVRYTFPSNDQEEAVVIEKKFDESNCQTARLGLPEGVQAVKPQGGDYSYSGMHDHGPLPLPKEGGPFASLIGMVNEARKHSDELLTKLIEEQQNSNVASTAAKIGTSNTNKRKKEKVSSQDSDSSNNYDSFYKEVKRQKT